MKTNLTIIFLLITLFTFSQKKHIDRNELKAEKKAFITKELTLTKEEELVFWPVYNSYEKEIHSSRLNRKQIHQALKNHDVLSESEVYKLTEKLLILEKKEASIRINYLKNFSGVVGQSKAAKVFHAEEKFKRELFKKLKHPPVPPPPPGH